MKTGAGKIREEEFQKEIERLSLEISEANRRITELEISDVHNNFLNPSSSVVEERAQIILTYMENHGRISTRQAKKILQTGHYQVHRAFELLTERFEEVKLTKDRRGMNVLQYNRSPAQVHKLVHLKSIDWPK